MLANLLLPDVASCANRRAKTLRNYIFIIMAWVGSNYAPAGVARSVLRRMSSSEKKKSVLDSMAKLRTANISFVISVRPSLRPHERTQLQLNGFSWNLIWAILKDQSRKCKSYYSLTRITDTLYEDLCTYTTLSRWILLRIRNISDKNCRENQNTFYVE